MAGNSLGDLNVRIGLDSSALDTGLNRLESSIVSAGDRIKKIGGGMKNFGTTMTKAVSAPLAGLVGLSVKVAMDFEAGMSEVQAISGATGTQLEMLKEKAKEMGSSTKFSATESAEAMKFMALAGWDTTQIMSGLEGVMSLSAASGFS